MSVGLSDFQRFVLREALLDPVFVVDFVHRLDPQGIRSDDELAQAISEELTPLLHRNLLRPLHFHGTSKAPFITPETDASEVLQVLESTVRSLYQPDFEPDDVDLWFDLTAAGEELALSLPDE